MHTVTVVGAGPAGLMAADVLSAAGVAVTIIDHKPAPARKFLLAGRGGLNLTHSEPAELFVSRYGDAQTFMAPMLAAFPPADVRRWAEGLGQETFIGTSGRVFPKVMKASPLLRALLKRLEHNGAVLKSNTRWQGFDGGQTILAMGGASWPETGSDAAWVPIFRAAGIQVNDFAPSNGRQKVEWSDHFREKFAGQPIKNLVLRHGTIIAKGEVAVTRDGIEGGAIYQLSASLRVAPHEPISIDLKPSFTEGAIAQRLSQPRGRMSEANFLRKTLALSPAAIGLLRETKTAITPQGIKNLRLQTHGFASLARAISSAGGVTLPELDAHCQLRKRPGTYCVGEMLDFDAPTGGYLLQACFSTAVVAARHVLSNMAK